MIPISSHVCSTDHLSAATHRQPAETSKTTKTGCGLKLCDPYFKPHMFCQCNEGTIDDGPVKNPNRAGCNVIETIRVLKFPQIQGSLQLARKVALDQVAYANEARGLKILKILGFSRCNEGTIVDGAVNNPNPTGCNVIETIHVLKFLQVRGSFLLAIKIALDQVAYESEARSLQSLQILGFSQCNEGTIFDGAVNNPYPTGCNVIETISVLKIQ